MERKKMEEGERRRHYEGNSWGSVLLLSFSYSFWPMYAACGAYSTTDMSNSTLESPGFVKNTLGFSSLSTAEKEQMECKSCKANT